MTTGGFKVAARAVIELGRELISSDGIAFYELIKNGLDAGSKTVNIVFDLPVHSEAWDRLNSEFAALDESSVTSQLLAHLKAELSKALDHSVHRSSEVAEAVRLARNYQQLRTAFRLANRVLVSDFGHGMSAKELPEVFLTIGTPYRRLQREKALSADDAKLPLGEKGIGRLSAMRLGSLMLVTTGRLSERNWNELTLDWEEFERRGNEPLENLSLQTSVGEKKRADQQGTMIDIRGLRRAWTRQQVEEVLKDDIRRLSDPFMPRAQPIATVERNGLDLPLSAPKGWLLKIAHGTIKANYFVSPEPHLRYAFTYALGDRSEQLHGVLGVVELTAQGENRIPPGILRRIGPFSVEAYWWNRQRIPSIDTIGTSKDIKAAIREWAGGLAIYRDEFRVNPYGRADNDWLGMDKAAFGSGGYKLNRQQLIGRVTISGRQNPHLLDQTNREGIQESPEFAAFRAILYRMLLTDFKAFLEQSELPPTTRDESTDQAIRRLKVSVQGVEARLSKRLTTLTKERRTWLQSVGLEADIESAIALCKEQLEKLRDVRDRERATKRQLLPAAGMGLMLDVVVHELNRSTSLAFDAAQQVLRSKEPARREQYTAQLRDELKTLRTRLTVLDDFAPSGRQRRDKFDAVRWLEDTVDYWEPRFREKQLGLELRLLPERVHHYEIYAVRGMLVQLVGNLLHNSLFWLSVGRTLSKPGSSKAVITLNTNDNRLVVWDDGPGVAMTDRNRIFQLGFSRRNAGEGKGLGLYIASEIARYHKTKIRLTDENAMEEGRMNSFEVDLRPIHVDR